MTLVLRVCKRPHYSQSVLTLLLKWGIPLQSTDFSRIQASGVSQILLKGQSYSAPPNMRAMVSSFFLKALLQRIGSNQLYLHLCMLWPCKSTQIGRCTTYMDPWAEHSKISSTESLEKLTFRNGHKIVQANFSQDKSQASPNLQTSLRGARCYICDSAWLTSWRKALLWFPTDSSCLQHVTNNWKSQHGGVFLDLSVLLFAFDGHHICSVDYSNQNSIGTERIGAVSHSGDQHTFEVDAIGVKMSQSADICLDCLVSILLLSIFCERPRRERSFLLVFQYLEHWTKICWSERRRQLTFKAILGECGCIIWCCQGEVLPAANCPQVYWLILQGRHVKEVYLVGSAWHTNLSHIMQPCIVLSDTGTGTELCQYQLEVSWTELN